MGAGAIGSLFASSLARSGVATTLLRRDNPNCPKVQNISIDKNGAMQERPFPTSCNSDPGPISHLLITTKAYDVQAALLEVSHRLDNHSCIFVLANGMGYMESLISDYPHLDFVSGTTTEGIYRLGENHFCHAGDGVTRFGRAGEATPPPAFDDWSNIDLPTTWEADIEECLWQKLALNCAINPLTAVHQCRNGELASAPQLTQHVTALCDEIARVSTAAGFNKTAANIHNRTKAVITSTANNRSSMLQDILAGRRTEIDYISGYLLKVAKRMEVATPYNTALFEDICRIDQERK